MNFEPLGTEDLLIATSQDAARQLYHSAIEMLPRCHHPSTRSCTASDTASDALYLAKTLLHNGDRSNVILDKILDTADRQNIPAFDLMMSLIARWYLCTLPALARARRARATDLREFLEGQPDDEPANSRIMTLGLWSLLFCSKAWTERSRLCDGQSFVAEGAVALIHLVYVTQWELVAGESMMSRSISWMRGHQLKHNK
ncbi:hypothetical protein VHEMI07103 [[Torrubiella] hemipterigena]|uniref:Uncharacterized protein n=1 Tax=[Torrubiella] hemipterigena TaxID=1531966 RepID=A0A0A1T2H6_9HYPO|nr:hypothetical protein VHEMI07103 [[Torrubiella] hemipterigena]